VGGRGKGKGGERGEDVEGPGKWSAPGPVLALVGPAYRPPNTNTTRNDGLTTALLKVKT